MQTAVHYGIHFGLPLAVALIFFKNNWKKAYLVMLLTFVIDLDHLLANPIFDRNRCSVGFHPLHSYYAIAVYFGFLFVKPLRMLGLGLVIHIIADTADCLLM
ncbi:MAG: hypothetical protein BM564_05560 [Bacteroidetes bacterium MedPE-SWsnd-G2]|nr:MAG: hypothetical protein BM564_05560 [Bacteroidetes bacterium MedPE-SWsnd-G2]